MPKEILDAADLQHRKNSTFTEIRDFMLQQARQRADVYVGDVCHATKKVGTVTPRVSANTNNPPATRATALVPMDVSQMSSNVSKPETEEQESDSYQYEQDQECDGDEVYAVKGKGKGGFKGTCLKCGMRGGFKGKGWSKGKWSNPGHTWDNSWYHSNWHGKAYGLEVDPWSAVKPVPYLCAVSLNSSCERHTHRKTLQHGSSRDFAHVNKFSILASDDDESPGECCTSEHTSRIQCQSRRCGDERGDKCSRGDERVDECITAAETRFSNHRRSGTSKLNAHQVSYFAASGGDNKGVHHVRGSGWRRLSAIMELCEDFSIG